MLRCKRAVSMTTAIFCPSSEAFLALFWLFSLLYILYSTNVLSVQVHKLPLLDFDYFHLHFTYSILLLQVLLEANNPKHCGQHENEVWVAGASRFLLQIRCIIVFILIFTCRMFSVCSTDIFLYKK